MSFYEKEGFMATIYPNKKDGKIISFKFKTFIGKDNRGKQVFKCKTWTPEETMSEKKMLKAAEIEASMWEKLVLKEYLEQKKSFEPNEISLEKFINQIWFPYQTETKLLKATTLAFHTYLLKTTLQYFGNIKLKNVSQQRIEHYLYYLRSEYKTARNAPLSPKTIRHHYCTLNLIFEYAVKIDYIQSNPMKKIDVPKLIRHKVDAFSKGEVLTFINEVEKLPQKQKAMYMILLTTGIRRGECFGLQWKDVDLENKLITIERTVSYTKQSGVTVSSPKTAASLRVVPITNKLIEILMSYRKEFSADFEINNSMFLFPSDKSPYTPHDPTYLTKHMSRFMKKTGMQNMSPHDLRHTCASLLLQSGADIKSVQDILGHADAATTLNFYAKSDIETMRSATQKAFDL